MTVAKRTPDTAYNLVRSYAADGDEHQAARVYAESQLSYPKFLKALQEGRSARVSGE